MRRQIKLNHALQTLAKINEEHASPVQAAGLYQECCDPSLAFMLRTGRKDFVNEISKLQMRIAGCPAIHSAEQD